MRGRHERRENVEDNYQEPWTFFLRDQLTTVVHIPLSLHLSFFFSLPETVIGTRELKAMKVYGHLSQETFFSRRPFHFFFYYSPSFSLFLSFTLFFLDFFLSLQIFLFLSFSLSIFLLLSLFFHPRYFFLPRSFYIIVLYSIST